MTVIVIPKRCPSISGPLDPLVEAGVVHAAVRRTTEANWGANKLHPRLIAETRQPVDSASG